MVIYFVRFFDIKLGLTGASLNYKHPDILLQLAQNLHFLESGAQGLNWGPFSHPTSDNGRLNPSFFCPARIAGAQLAQIMPGEDSIRVTILPG